MTLVSLASEPCRGVFFNEIGHGVAEGSDFAIEVNQALRRHTGRCKQSLTQTACLFAQCLSLNREAHNNLSLVFGIPFPYNEVSLFKPFHEGCDRARFERQPIGDISDALRIAFPQCAQNKILRVGDFQGVQQRLVSTADRHAGAIQRKAELLIECDFIHGHSLHLSQ
jgi:hypothetical protein